MGRVRPVITVDRQELRKQKTMRMVSNPPRIRVSCTSCTESRIMIEASRTISTVVPGGSSFCRTSISFFTRSTTPTVLAPDCLRISSPMAGNAVYQGQRPLLFDAVMNLRYFGQGNRTPCPPGDYHGFELFDGVGFSRNPQGVFRAAPGSTGRAGCSRSPTANRRSLHPPPSPGLPDGAGRY